MKLYLDAMRLLAGALSLASVAGLRASSDNDPLEVLRKLISSSNFDSAALKQSLGSLNSKLTQKHFEKQHGRHLETDRDCGEVIASVTLAEVQALLEVSVSFLLQDPSLASFRVIARQLLFSDVKYGFKAVKVCMSCEEALDVLSEEQLANSDPFSYSSYCSEEKYGYGAEHSALVFLPVDPATGEVFKASMRAIVSSHGTLFDLADAPTEFWPSSMTEYLATNSATDIIAYSVDYLFAAVGAASGAIVVNPDYIGYGQSVDYDRSFAAPLPYAQSFAMSWLATHKYVANSTAGCSELENVATVSGYSEGGYAALPGAFALRQLGVTIWGAYSGGAVYQPIEQYAAISNTFADGPPTDPIELYLLTIVIAFTGYSYSNEFPFLANTGADQPLLADFFRMPETPQNVIDWFAVGSTIGQGYVEFVPENSTDMFNADFNAIFAAARADGVTDPCTDYVTSTTDKLCQALQEASLIPLLEQADFNTVLCHSPDDEIAYYSNVPSFPFSNERVSLYAGIPVVNILQPMGGHGVSGLICAISPILSFQVSENGPVQITPKQCPATVKESVAPAESETPAPAGSGTPAPDSPTMAPSESSASTNIMFLSTASIVLGLMLGSFAI